MPEHIDVISYLLGAIVFSVGFLSARLHASADAQRQQVSDASWRIREIRAKGGRLAPDELGALLSLGRITADSIASLVRMVNLALVAAVLAVAVDFLLLVADGVQHSPHAVFLTALLGSGALAVGVVGEIDAQHLKHSLARALSQTSLGHVGRLERALARNDLSRSRAEIATLERVFPDWGLLVELEALVAYRAGDHELALQAIRDHLDMLGDVYLAAVVGSAAAMELGRPEVALEVLDAVASRRPLDSEEQTLLHALRLHAGNLDEVLDGSQRAAAGAVGLRSRATADPTMFSWVGFEDVARQRRSSALDARVTDFPPLVRLIDDLRAWNTSTADELTTKVGPFALLRSLIAEGRLSEEGVADAVAFVQRTGDSAAIETTGIVLLLGGHAKEAVGVLERGMRANPKSPRIHWTHAVGCMYWGWWDKAAESLGRAASLDADDIVVRLTRRRLEGASESEPIVVPPAGLSQVERVQMALVGVETSPTAVERSSRRLALAAAAVGMAQERARSLRFAVGSEASA